MHQNNKLKFHVRHALLKVQELTLLTNDLSGKNTIPKSLNYQYFFRKIKYPLEFKILFSFIKIGDVI